MPMGMTGNGGRDAAGRQILVVDDEPMVRRMIGRLVVEGYRVDEAGDGFQALEKVRAAPDALDLVVTDLAMPRLNGLELAQVLSAEVPGLPLVLISGFAAPELQALGMVAPCGTLTKPLAEAVFL